MKKKLIALATIFALPLSAYATAPSMGDLINANVDVGSSSAVVTAIAGSSLTIAGIVAAVRIGKRLIRSL